MIQRTSLHSKITRVSEIERRTQAGSAVWVNSRGTPYMVGRDGSWDNVSRKTTNRMVSGGRLVPRYALANLGRAYAWHELNGGFVVTDAAEATFNKLAVNPPKRQSRLSPKTQQDLKVKAIFTAEKILLSVVGHCLRIEDLIAKIQNENSQVLHFIEYLGGLNQDEGYKRLHRVLTLYAESNSDAGLRWDRGFGFWYFGPGLPEPNFSTSSKIPSVSKKFGKLREGVVYLLFATTREAGGLPHGYIGKTTNPKSRSIAHLSGRDPSSHNFVAAMEAAGHQVAFSILKSGIRGDELDAWETRFIKTYEATPGYHLWNRDLKGINVR